MKACKGMLEEHSKKMSDRMDEMDKKTKASDDAEATKLTSKAQGLIDAHRGGKITPAEAKDLEKKLSDKTVTPEYVESFVTAKAGIQAGGNGGGQAAPPALDFGFTEEIVINLRANPETKHLKSATAQVMNDLAGEIVINARNYSERIAHNGQVFHLKAKTPEAVAASWRGNVTRYQANEKRKKTIVPPRYIDESQPFLVL